MDRDCDLCCLRCSSLVRHGFSCTIFRCWLKTVNIKGIKKKHVFLWRGSTRSTAFTFLPLLHPYRRKIRDICSSKSRHGYRVKGRNYVKVLMSWEYTFLCVGRSKLESKRTIGTGAFCIVSICLLTPLGLLQYVQLLDVFLFASLWTSFSFFSLASHLPVSSIKEEDILIFRLLFCFFIFQSTSVPLQLIAYTTPLHKHIA